MFVSQKLAPIHIHFRHRDSTQTRTTPILETAILSSVRSYVVLKLKMNVLALVYWRFRRFQKINAGIASLRFFSDRTERTSSYETRRTGNFFIKQSTLKFNLIYADCRNGGRVNEAVVLSFRSTLKGITGTTRRTSRLFCRNYT